MTTPAFHDEAVRVPLWQLMLNGRPCVVTDLELARLADGFRQHRTIMTCLGSAWARQYRPEMVELWRYRMGTTTETGMPSESRLALHGVSRPVPAWTGMVPDRQLGWVFPASEGQLADDLCLVAAYAPPTRDDGDSYYYTNGQDLYPGHLPTPPWFGAPDYTQDFIIHAPQVIQVSVQWQAPNAITLNPDEVVVSAGKGAPLIWRRGNGLTGSGLQFSLASLAIDENTTPPAPGQSYRPVAQFIVRHVTPDEIVVIDNNDFDDQSEGEVFDYRLSVYDEDRGMLSVDPKIRNGSTLGSGAPGLGGG